MSDYHKYAHNITKGKLPGEHWNQFLVEYKKDTNRLSGTQFALNIVSIMMDEHVWQEKDLVGFAEEFVALVKRSCEQDFSAEELKADFDVYRGKMKDIMECLVAYNDRFLIYQYVMSILKYRYEEYKYEDYSDEEFTKELVNYIISDRDQSNIRFKTMSVLRCLPIRMTKNKFFEMVKDGFSVYRGGDSDSLESFDYMIRSACTLAGNPNMEDYFPELYKYNEHFKNINYEELDEENYYDECMTLSECIDYLSSSISSFQLLAEGVNQLYAFVLTSEEMNDIEFANVVKNIIEMAVEADPVGFEPDEKMVMALSELEGVQEEMMELLMDADGSMEDILGSEFAAVAGDEILSEFELVDRLRLLVSSSYFADIEQKEEITEVTEADAAIRFQEFKKDMTELLGAVPKIMGRALMSACIGCLPMNFSNTDELSAYIGTSLSACTNLAEKMALVEQLEAIMDNDMDDYFGSEDLQED